MAKEKKSRKPRAVEVRDKPDAKKKALFIAALRATGHVGKAVEACAAGRSTVYAWRKKDLAFRAAWTEAEDAATDDLLAEATRRAFLGTVKPVVYKGMIAKRITDEGTVEDLYIREYSDTLLMFLLKARDPFKYCDRARTARIERRWAKFDANAAATTQNEDEFALSMSERQLLDKKAEAKAKLAEAPA